jgi:ribose transport system ATP-binding protein
MAAAVSCEDVSLTFGETRALREVSVEITRASWTGLVGENGAGKSTLLGVLSGRLRPDRGQIRIDGETVGLESMEQAAEAGVLVFSQTAMTVPRLSVYENVFLGYQRRFRRRGRVSHTLMRQRATPHIEAVLGPDVDLRAPIGELPYGSQQLFQLARVLARADLLGISKPTLLVDEATAALDTSQSDRLFGILEDLSRRGATIVYVTHRLRELVGRADRIVVMRDGEIAGELEREEATEAGLHSLMVGRTQIDQYYCQDLRSSPSGSPVLEVEGLTATVGSASVQGVEVVVNGGELVGLAGVDGSGKEIAAEVIAGVSRAEQGTIRVRDRELNSTRITPGAALNAGIGYLPSDRLGQSVIASQTVSFNIGLLLRGAGRRLGWLRDFWPYTDQAKRTLVAGAAERMKVTHGRALAQVGSLSGGNQQKVAMAKWSLADLKILVTADLTQGIDIAARHECYRLLREMCANGTGVLLVSNDLPELLGMADRVVVMRRGRVVNVIARSDRELFTEESIVRMMVG